MFVVDYRGTEQNVILNSDVYGYRIVSSTPFRNVRKHYTYTSQNVL